VDRPQVSRKVQTRSVTVAFRNQGRNMWFRKGEIFAPTLMVVGCILNAKVAALLNFCVSGSESCGEDLERG
jgi:hypothetical protein